MQCVTHYIVCILHTSNAFSDEKKNECTAAVYTHVHSNSLYAVALKNTWSKGCDSKL